MKLRHSISILVIVLAIGSLSFTTLFFYDYNSKIVMVEEVQEENNEDVISSENDYELNCYHNWTEWILPSSAVKLIDQGTFAQNHADPHPGYFLDLIKPPIH